MSDQTRQTSTRLARAIDAALSRCDLVEADLLSRTALRLARRSPLLIEAMARCHLSMGRPDMALSVLSERSKPSSSARMLRAIALLELGRTTEARMELLPTDGPEAPAQARLLAALLAWEAGDLNEAASLARSVERGPWAPFAEAVLTALHVASDDTEAAATPAKRLHALAALPGLRKSIRSFLASLGLRRTNDIPDADPMQIAELASEMAAAPAMVPRLVQESHRTLDRHGARLLRDVVRASAEAEPGRSDLVVALADLTDLLDGPAAAREVTRRGLAAHPLSATLRLLEAQFQRHAEQTEGGAPAHAAGAEIFADDASRIRKIAA